jgi:hypothetical protein
MVAFYQATRILSIVKVLPPFSTFSKAKTTPPEEFNYQDLSFASL